MLDTILSTPVDIAALGKEGAPRERRLDGAMVMLPAMKVSTLRSYAQ
jgi:hypothetical protein